MGLQKKKNDFFALDTDTWGNQNENCNLKRGCFLEVVAPEIFNYFEYQLGQKFHLGNGLLNKITYCSPDVIPEIRSVS